MEDPIPAIPNAAEPLVDEYGWEIDIWDGKRLRSELDRTIGISRKLPAKRSRRGPLRSDTGHKHIGDREPGTVPNPYHDADETVL